MICDAETREAVASVGGEMLSTDTVLLGFMNFIGEASIAGVRLKVVSSKIDAEGISLLLQEVSEMASSLVFAHGSPASLEASGEQQTKGAIPYHQLQFLRRSMVVESAGRRLQDWLSLIERAPIRAIERERPVLPIGRIQRLDHRAMRSVFQHMDRLVPVPVKSPVEDNLLAKALTFGDPPTRHFPKEVASPRGKLSFDTPENRFVRHVVDACLALIYRFADHPKLHPRLRAECRSMLSLLEDVAAQPFLRECTRLTSLITPTQALAKTDGYREVLAFWMSLQESMALPMDPNETARMLEGRNVAQLYEYWVFLKVLSAVVEVTGQKPSSPPQTKRDELGETLTVNVSTGIGPGISVSYNASFTRSNKTAYSTPLKPDVVLATGEVLIAFDAKYRLDALQSDEDDSDSGAGTYKRADLYKMHAYRDAIHSMEAAFVVYPGSEFKFFDRDRGLLGNPSALGRPNGVGAIPLRPQAHADFSGLRTVIHQILTSSSSVCA